MLTDRELQMIFSKFNAQLEPLVRQVQELKSKVEELTNGKRSKVRTRGRKRIQQTEENPNHPTKSHVVVAKDGDKIKTIRFGQQGVKGAGKNPKTAKDKARRKSYYARHNAQDPNPSKLSARYWSHKVKW